MVGETGGALRVLAGIKSRTILHDRLAQALHSPLMQHHDYVVFGKTCRPGLTSRCVQDDAHVLRQVNECVLGSGENLPRTPHCAVDEQDVGGSQRADRLVPRVLGNILDE